MKGLLFILSSPSGGGKTSIAKALLESRDDLGYSISATTRTPRAGEEHGKDYFFLSSEEFRERQDRGEFLESEQYGSHWYGTLLEQVDHVQAGGRHVIMDIEVQGARIARRQRDDVVSVFVLPPTAQVLADRLRGRSSESGDSLRRRIEAAAVELEEATEYDYIVVNDKLEEAVAAVGAIIDSECLRTRRLPVDAMINELKEGLRALRGQAGDSQAKGERG